MDKTLLTDLENPRFEPLAEMKIAGLSARYNMENIDGISDQWERFMPHIGHVPGQVGQVCYGVCRGYDENSFEYIASVEVFGDDDLPEEFVSATIPDATYAVFSHRDHISEIGKTHYTIWNKWLPESGRELALTPSFEKYDERFDPETGTGVVEIWVPLKG